MFAVCEEMNFRVAVDDFGQAFAEFAVEEADDLSYSLQRKSFAAKLADDDDLGELIHRVAATMPLALRSNDAALVPPLQLAGGDAGQGDDVSRCVAILHSSSEVFETISMQNVSHILGMAACGSSKEIKGLVTKRVPAGGLTTGLKPVHELRRTRP